MKIMKVKFLVLAALFLLALLSASEAAYKLHLRNGSVIEGVSAYQREKGEIRFKLGAGEIGIPEKDVLRIEEYKPARDEVLKEEVLTQPEEKAAPAPPEMKGTTKESSAGRVVTLRNRINRVNREIEEIEEKEKELKDLKDELNLVRLRIENLYRKGRNSAFTIINGQKFELSPESNEAKQRYMEFLSEDERKMVQMNFMKKRKLEAEIKEKEEDPDFQAALTEKKRLLDERKALEDEITSLQSAITF